jgi:hypothetical protein
MYDLRHFAKGRQHQQENGYKDQTSNDAWHIALGYQLDPRQIPSPNFISEIMGRWPQRSEISES